MCLGAADVVRCAERRWKNNSVHVPLVEELEEEVGTKTRTSKEGKCCFFHPATESHSFGLADHKVPTLY